AEGSIEGEEPGPGALARVGAPRYSIGGPFALDRPQHPTRHRRSTHLVVTPIARRLRRREPPGGHGLRECRQPKPGLMNPLETRCIVQMDPLLRQDVEIVSSDEAELALDQRAEQ